MLDESRCTVVSEKFVTRAAAVNGYPSGSATFCSEHAQSARRFLGWDVFNWSVPAPKGSSMIEPDVKPSGDTVLGPWLT
jgi:hypothetical protein